MRNITLTLAMAALMTTGSAGWAETAVNLDPANIDATSQEDGRYFAENEVPTYNVAEDGTVDYPSYNGFRRYHSECHVCHGPDGEGSSYAPALKASALNMDYYDFLGVVAEGLKKVNAAENQVMPSFGDNVNVMCFIDDIYVYLKARGTDAIPRGRPGKKEGKTELMREDENDCLG